MFTEIFLSSLEIFLPSRIIGIPCHTNAFKTLEAFHFLTAFLTAFQLAITLSLTR